LHPESARITFPTNIVIGAIDLRPSLPCCDAAMLRACPAMMERKAMRAIATNRSLSALVAVCKFGPMHHPPVGVDAMALTIVARERLRIGSDGRQKPWVCAANPRRSAVGHGLRHAEEPDPLRPQPQDHAAGASLTIPWFDPNGHPFVPTCRAAEPRAQRKSPRRGRSEAEHRALARLTERARRYPQALKTNPKITPERA